MITGAYMSRCIAVLIAAISLANCTTVRDVSSASSPVRITGITATVIDLGTDNIIRIGYTASLFFSIAINGPDVFDRISLLKITGPLGNEWTWSGDGLKKHWNKKTGFLELDFLTSAAHKDFIPLGVYKAEFFDSHDNVFTKSIPVYGRSDGARDSGSVYTRASGKLPTILDPPIVNKAVKKGDSILVDFEIRDGRVTNSFIWFYAGDTYLGTSEWLYCGGPENGEEKTAVTMNVECPYPKTSCIYLVAYSGKYTLPNEVTYECVSGKVVLQ